jgi:hypothetical protein
MKTPNDPKSYEQEYYHDEQGNPHYVERVTEPKDGDTNAYRHGYTHGRAAERSHQYDLSTRDSENTARGLLVGALLATLAALGGAYAWYLNQPKSSSSPVAPVVVPAPEKSQPNPVPEQQTTIIERVKEVPVERVKEVPVERVKEVPVVVPVPEQVTPAPNAVSPNPPVTEPQSTEVPPTETQNSTSENDSNSN